jgi:hypothetical protein
MGNNRPRKFVWGAVILLIILHQDVWFWDSFNPLLFGFMPISMAYHILISILAASVWFVATKVCWPEFEEDSEGSVKTDPEK